MLGNLFVLEAEIIDRLRGTIPDLKTVCDLSAVPPGTQVTELLPAVFLQDGGAEASESPRRVANRIIETQTWAAIVAVPYMADGNQTPEWLEAAGALLARVYQALHDWQAPCGASLSYAQRDEAYYADGYLEIPVHFTAQMVLDWPE